MTKFFMVTQGGNFKILFFVLKSSVGMQEGNMKNF